MSLAHVQVHGRFRACFWWRGWSIRWQGIGGLGVSADIHGFWIQEGAKDLDKWNRRIKSHESQTWFITYVIPAIRYPVSATDTVYQPLFFWLWSRVWTKLTPNRALNNARLGTIKINTQLGSSFTPAVN